MARPGIVTAVTTANGGAAVGPVEDHAAPIQVNSDRCQVRRRRPRHRSIERRGETRAPYIERSRLFSDGNALGGKCTIVGAAPRELPRNDSDGWRSSPGLY